MTRFPIIIIGIVGLLLTIAGLLLGFTVENEFLKNLGAELVGLGIAVLVGVFLVDRLVQHYRSIQWAKSRNYVLGGIASHLADFASDIFVFLPVRNDRPLGNILEGRNEPKAQVPSALRTLANELRNTKESGSRDKSLSDLTIELYEHSKWDLDQIQNVLTPRVLQSEAEQDLIHALMDFDQARRDLHSGIISHKLVVTGAPYPALITLVEASANLYEVLNKHWKPQRKKAEKESNQIRK